MNAVLSVRNYQAGFLWRNLSFYPNTTERYVMNESVITLVDQGLALAAERSLFSSDEVADLLLDIRLAALTEELIPA